MLLYVCTLLYSSVPHNCPLLLLLLPPTSVRRSLFGLITFNGLEFGPITYEAYIKPLTVAPQSQPIILLVWAWDFVVPRKESLCSAWSYTRTSAELFLCFESRRVIFTFDFKLPVAPLWKRSVATPRSNHYASCLDLMMHRPLSSYIFFETLPFLLSLSPAEGILSLPSLCFFGFSSRLDLSFRDVDKFWYLVV